MLVDTFHGYSNLHSLRFLVTPVLRMEQDVEKFMRDPSRQQMEFQQLPTSYLRLAAHRVAQHYALTSMVLVDNSLPDGSARIIVCKSSESRMPSIRLADIPVNLPQEDTSVIKVAIKQRPQRGSQFIGTANSQSLKNNSSKSVEERKEEYNRARARIFSSNNLVGSANGKTENEPKMQDTSQHVSQRMPKIDEKASSAGSSEVNTGRGSPFDSSTVSNRSARSRTEKEQIGRSKTSNRVAIFRDREIDRKDPDYDRNYDRYILLSSSFSQASIWFRKGGNLKCCTALFACILLSLFGFLKIVFTC